jgi:hypothetical protein
MIGGGGFNTIVGSDLLPVYSTIGGGKGNTIQTNASYDVVGGGAANVILAENAYGTIAGGLSNSITGSYGAVAGGDMNNATANSFAAGHRAKALHGGTFVWGDAQDSDFASSGTDQFLIRASGGVGINTNNPAGAALNVAGTVKASTFQGDGSGLFNVGAGALGNYVFAIGGQQTIAVANVTQDITFDTDAQINGWMHTAGEASYTNSQTGLYVIQYTGVASISVNSGITISIRAALNGSVISGSSAGVAMTVAGQASDISRSFVVSAVAGDILKLQLRASNTSVLLTGLSTVGPAVTMTMVRIQ